MRYSRWSLSAVLLGALAFVGTAWGAGPKIRPTPTNFDLLETIQLPTGSAPLTQFDITWFDPTIRTSRTGKVLAPPAISDGEIYFADASNKAVQQINSPKNALPTFVQSINKGGFAGTQNTSDFDANGPDGIITFNNSHGHELWVGDATPPDATTNCGPDGTVGSGNGCIHGRIWSFKINSSAPPLKNLATPPTTLFAPISTDCGSHPLVNGDVLHSSTAVSCPPEPWERADEGAYDPTDNIIVIANPHPAPGGTSTGCGTGGAFPCAFGPYLTFINAGTGAIIDQMVFPQATGIEQSVWDPVSGTFFMNLPQDSNFGNDLNGSPVGGVVQIKVTGGVPAVVGEFATKIPGGAGGVSGTPISCEGNGLALNTDVSPEQLLIGCSAVTPIPSFINPPPPGFGKAGGPGAFSLIMETNGTPVAAPATGGSDEVWFDPGDNTYYLGEIFTSFNLFPPGVASQTPALGIINGSNNSVQAQYATAFAAHNVAADSLNDRVFLPMPPNTMAFDNSALTNPDDKFSCRAGCVAVYGPLHGEAGE